MGDDDNKLTKSSVQIILDAQEEREDLRDREERLKKVEFRQVEIIGVDGKSGRLCAVEETVESHSKDIHDLKVFKSKAIMLASMAAAAAGALIPVIQKLISYLLK